MKELPLTSLTVFNCVRFQDLSVLAGKPITHLSMNSTRVADFSPMRQMPLEHLEMNRLAAANLADLGFIPTAKLKTLDIDYNASVHDLSSLRGAGIEDLSVSGTAVTDISALATMPNLVNVQLTETMISDVTPLAGPNIQRVMIDGCPRLRSVAPLARLANLRTLALPPAARDVESLRGMKSLAWIGYGYVPQLTDTARHESNIAAFWKMYDLEKELRAAEPDGKLRPGRFPHMKTRFPAAEQLGGHWYAWFAFVGTWEEARACAEEMGGHLATITSDDEYRLTRALGNYYLGAQSNYGVWLGGYTDKPGGPWRWVTGEPWGYTRWTKRDAIQEPSGFANGTQTPETVLAIGDFIGNQAAADTGMRRGWNDLAHDDPTAQGFIVEWED
jgi:hypothetical protein